MWHPPLVATVTPDDSESISVLARIGSLNPFPGLVSPGCRARPSVALASDGRLVVASVGRTAYRSSACDSTMTYKKPSAQRRRLWLAGEPGREERRQRLSLARCQAQPAPTGRAVMRSTLRGH